MTWITQQGIAGASYLATATCLFALVWVGARYVPGRNVRLFLRAACLAMLVTPWPGGLDKAQFAPAAIVGAFAFMDTGWEEALLTLQPLLGVLSVIAAAIVLKGSVDRRRSGVRSAGAEAQQNDVNKET